jgi:glutaminyl-tRNA synthetase
MKAADKTEIGASQQNFIEEIIDKDIHSGKVGGEIHTRFPPEPNGYLHIGHAKSICLNFGIADKYKGLCNLRFDDTNPETEEAVYVNSIKEDIRWLGFDWEEREYYASDYFDALYGYAVKLIKMGVAYVDDQSADEISDQKGVPTKPGKISPYRERPIEENLDLFRRMRNGEYPDGAKVLRAKIDMSSPNMHLRDPALYRIKRMTHFRTGDTWCIYPMYDFAHGQSDYIEGITHSICTLEFEVHRPLYDWFLDYIAEIGHTRPRQIEFARLSMSYTVLSKRKLLELVNGKFVNGWDDPRMPTISGMRRRGYGPEAIKNFVTRIGVAKRDNLIDFALLEFSIREDLNKRSLRKMAVLDPLKVVITNFPENQTEVLEALNNPENESGGHRKIQFSREIFIDREDFMEIPPKDYYRLSPGKEVRLKYAYIIKCEKIMKDPQSGEITEIHCSFDPLTKSGLNSRKVKGTIHWVPVKHAVQAEVRLYDRLFLVEDPGSMRDTDFRDLINPDSLKVINPVYIEESVAGARPYNKYQFERNGYFCVDPDSKNGNLIFNRTVTLKDTWAKIRKKS